MSRWTHPSEAQSASLPDEVSTLKNGTYMAAPTTPSRHELRTNHLLGRAPLQVYATRRLERGGKLLAGLLLLVSLCACPSSRPNDGSTPAHEGGDGAAQSQSRNWRAVSDMDPVWSLASTEEHLWVGTPGGLLRYDLHGGAPLRVSGSAGPIKGRVVGVQTDSNGKLWAVSEGGIGRYEGGAWSRPTGPMPDVGELSAFVVMPSNALWLGGTEGLVTHHAGQWTRWSGDAEVTSIAPPFADGRIWVGTKRGAIEISTDGFIAHHDQDRGMPCDVVRSIVASEDRVWALCSRSDGLVLAHYDGNRWQGFTVELSQAPMDLGVCNNRFILLTDDGLWRIEGHDPEEDDLERGELPLATVFSGAPARPSRERVNPSEASGNHEMRTAQPRPRPSSFAPPPEAPEDPWLAHPVTHILRPIDVPVYHGAACVSCDSRGVWIGTEGLGTTRVGRGGEVTVYRTLDLVVDDRPFSVAADGEGNSWFLSRDLRAGVLGSDINDSFEPSHVEQDATSGFQILAFGSRGLGAYALGRMRGTNVLRVYQRARGDWVEMLERELSFAPDPEAREALRDNEEQEPLPDPFDGLRVDFSFFEVDEEGRFWIGLLSRPAHAPNAEPTPHGVLVIDLELDELVLHGQEPRGPGALRVPNDINVVDFTSDGDTWLAGLTGAVVIRSDGTMDRFSEANGLLGGIVNDLAIDANDVPWVATPEGLGRYQQGSWRFFMDNMPEEVHVLSLAVDSRGELWAGGNRGAVHYDGRSWEVFTTASGLISNRIRSVHTDGRDRVWFVTAAGISLLERSD